MKNENQPRSSTQSVKETSSCDEKTCPTKKKKPQLKKANENLHSLTII